MAIGVGIAVGGAALWGRLGGQGRPTYDVVGGSGVRGAVRRRNGGPPDSTGGGNTVHVTAKSGVDLESKRAWLFDNGTISRGPVTISSGGSGEETPVGPSLRVYRKDQDHTTAEFKLPNGQPAPMPYSVFFADGGIAFHGVDPKQASAGCIHLPLADAQAWFAYLQVGDQVQVVRASREYAARKADANSGSGDADLHDKTDTSGGK